MRAKYWTLIVFNGANNFLYFNYILFAYIEKNNFKL